MAHRCWAIDEVVRAIVENLVRDEERASAVALASCSKSLEEPALGEVWRSLRSLAPLVKCFPPDVWEIRGKKRNLFFKRAPTQAEWSRFQKRYASKVQHLMVYRYNFPLSSTALHILHLYSSDGPLLPNLISLDWSTDEILLPFISLFISPSLMSIAVQVPIEASTVLPPILERLSKLSHNIREIEIETSWPEDRLHHDPSMEEATSQLLMHCDHRLRKFRVDSSISTSALRHVIQLPSLEEIWLVLLNSLQLPDPLPTLVFPSLRELEVEYSGKPTWLKLLPAIGSPVLTSITVTCPRSDVDRFMEAFQGTMTGCGMHESLREFMLESPDNFQITQRIIARISSFKNLTSLTLSSECGDQCQTTNLTDDDIDLLTKAMPCLESLTLGSTPCAVPSQVTFKSLYAISRRCTQLTYLLLHFEPTRFVSSPVTEFESWDVALNTSSSDLCPLTTICVGNIPLPTNRDASSILALGLLGLFPRLTEIESQDDDWRPVESLVETFRQMGCSAFGKG